MSEPMDASASRDRATPAIFAGLAQWTLELVLVVAVVTGLLALPFLFMAPDESASTEPTGAVFDARDLVDERFVDEVFDTPFLGEFDGGDILRADPLRALLAAENELRTDPTLGPTLYEWYVPEVDVRAVGMFSLADFVDLELRRDGVEDGLSRATDAEVKEAGAALIARYGANSLLLELSQRTITDGNGEWIVPGIGIRVLSDDKRLGFGNRSINLGADTAPEEYSRELQAALRTAEGWDIYGVGIDVNLTSAEQGALAGPFIGLAFLAALLMLGAVFRSYWVVAVVSSVFLILLIWLKGVSNLIGLQESMALSLIVPIAMISFGVDYAFHSIGRYREERAAGRVASQAAVLGTAAVSGALVLAAVSDSVAFLANTTAGIDSVVQFGIGAAIALAAAWLLLGILTPYLVAWIEERVPEPEPGRWSTVGRCAGSFGAVLLATASVLLMVFLLPWAGLVLAVVTVLVTLVIPVLVQGGWSVGRRVGQQLAPNPTRRFAPALGEAVVRLTEWRVTVVFAAAAITVMAAVFATQVPTRFDVKDFFSADSEFVVALDLLDEHVGSQNGELATVYIEGDITDPARLAQLDLRLQQLRNSDSEHLARDADGVRLFGYGVLEVIDAAWDSPAMLSTVQKRTGTALTDADGDGIPDTAEQIKTLLQLAQRGIPSDAGGPDQLLMTPDEVAVRVDLSRTPYATTIELGIGGSRDQQVIEQVQADLAPITQAISEDFDGSFVQLTGSPLARAASLNATSRALFISLPLALLACFLVAALFLKSVRFGLASITPIAMVVAWLYAFMERAGYAINLVTATIGAISVGIGVDFALHYISRFREELERTGIREHAVRAAAEGTGVALVASTASSAVGFGILAFAPMPLFATYGLLTVVMVVAALAATLMVLPSLLVLITADTIDTADTYLHRQVRQAVDVRAHQIIWADDDDVTEPRIPIGSFGAR